VNGPVTPRARILAALLVLSPSLVCAESLQEAWQKAIAHDNSLAAASADTEEARASERAARAARWPSLSANAGYTRFDNAPQFQFAAQGAQLNAPIFRGDEYASGGVQVKVPLYTGGRISAGIGAAHQAALGADEAERVAQSALRLDVAEAYVDVLRAGRLERTAESSVASLRAHAGDVQSMVERELVARSDLLAARVALANADQQRVRAENGVAIANAAYNRRIGEPLDRLPNLEDTVPVDAALAAQPVESLLEQALQTRSEVSALTARAGALALQARAERADLLPQFAITGGYTYFDNVILDRRDFTSVGVGFTWNLFDGGQARHRSAALRSASRATERRVDDLRSQIELQVREAWLNVREARARVTASGEAVAQAEENLRITRELYGSGLGTNTQVLDAVALQVSAINNRDNAALDESLALLRLAHAVGTL
jgi:outer membrane protein TolC